MASALKRGVWLLGIALIFVGFGVSAKTAFDPQSALSTSQAAIGRQLEDLQFRDAGFRPVSLTDFRGKPLLINLIYTSCSYDCPVVLETLAEAIDVARAAVDPDSFKVLTIGFDTRVDTPQRMRAFAASHGIHDRNWFFLGADGETVDRLAAAVGFQFYPSAKGFDHLAQTTVVDAEGVIYAQVYGSDFDPPFLVEPLKDLVFGRRSAALSVDGLLNRIRLFCTVYDPSSGRYRFDYSPFIAIVIGAVLLSAMGIVIVRGWRRPGGPQAKA